MATKIRSKKNTMKNTGGMPQWQGLAAPKNAKRASNMAYNHVLKYLTFLIAQF